MAAQLSADQLEQVIIDLVAEDLKEDPGELRARLEEQGQELPIDSLLLTEILTRVEQLAGVRLPADINTADSMRSVKTFVARILEVVESQEVNDEPQS